MSSPGGPASCGSGGGARPASSPTQGAHGTAPAPRVWKHVAVTLGRPPASRRPAGGSRSSCHRQAHWRSDEPVPAPPGHVSGPPGPPRLGPVVRSRRGDHFWARFLFPKSQSRGRRTCVWSRPAALTLPWALGARPTDPAPAGVPSGGPPAPENPAVGETEAGDPPSSSEGDRLAQRHAAAGVRHGRWLPHGGRREAGRHPDPQRRPLPPGGQHVQEEQ